MRDLEKHAKRLGVATSYRSAGGDVVASPARSVELAVEALADAPRPSGGDAVVLLRGDSVAESDVTIELEGGGKARLKGKVPEDFPLGYHRFHGRSLIVAPPSCVLPARRMWGWALQLYAMESKKSLGMGDLSQLRDFARWARSAGAGFVMINPIAAISPAGPPEPSPYFPTTRMFRNPLYIDIGKLADVKRGRGTRRDSMIDRARVWKTKLPVLEKAFEGFRGDRRFDSYLKEQSQELSAFAAFSAISEQYGPRPKWPSDLSVHDSSGVRRFRKQNASRVRFYEWLQWVIDLQLGEAGEELSIVQDLAIGADPGGAESWTNPQVFASDFSVGAPPDQFNRLGQDWSFSPFNPVSLNAAEYEPFIKTLRATFRHSGGIRIDHVMGLFRLFWIPRGSDPKEGVYVHYPWRDLVHIVALESTRQNAFVVGEDLGTVEPDVRKKLARAGVLSYKVLLFEGSDPANYPRRSLASTSTHDLPTIAGIWSGFDLAQQQRLNLDPDEAAMRGLQKVIREASGKTRRSRVSDVALATYDMLARTRSLLVAASLEDVLEVKERTNFPGTTGGWPNWSRRLPLTVEEIIEDERVLHVAERLSEVRGLRPR